jgi:Flp pilus assembly pilin Flp
VSELLLGFYVKAQTFWGDLRERISSEKGAVATEYALLLVFIAVAIAAAVGILGKSILDKFEKANTELNK